MIPSRLHTREKIIDWLPRLLLYSDKSTSKLILVREADSDITTSREVPNILRILIMTKLQINRRHSSVVELSDDLVIFSILVFEVIRETLFIFIRRTDKRCDVTSKIIP